MTSPMIDLREVSDPHLTLGERVRKARMDSKMQQAELADVVHVSRALVSKWERGVSVPDLNQARAIAETTHVSLGWLAGVPVRSRIQTTSLQRFRPRATKRRMNDDDELLTTAQVAERAKVNRVTVGRWVAQGDLAAVRLPGGRALRFRRSDVDRMLTPEVSA